MNKNEIILDERISEYYNGLRLEFEKNIKTIHDTEISNKVELLVKNEIKRIENILNGSCDIVSFKKISDSNNISIGNEAVKGRLQEMQTAIIEAYNNGTRNLNLNLEKDLNIFAWSRAYKYYLIYLNEKLPLETSDKESISNKQGFELKHGYQTVTDFFERVRYSDLTEIEKINTIEHLTNNYSLEKLQILSHDFNEYLSNERKSKLDEFSEQDIKNTIEYFNNTGQEIPCYSLPPKIFDNNGERIKFIIPRHNINMEFLLFPFDFIDCYLFQMYLDKLIKQQESKKVETQNIPQYSTIESIFYDINNIQKVINCLIDHETLNENGELIKESYHILAITEALVMKGIVNKDVSKTQRNKLFAIKLNKKISDKTSRAKSKLHQELITEYKELFDSLQ
jgi:hypothetical protein